METAQVKQCAQDLVMALYELENAKGDYKLKVDAAFEAYGVANKVEQRNLLKIAKAKIAGKTEDLQAEIDSASDLLTITSPM